MKKIIVLSVMLVSAQFAMAQTFPGVNAVAKKKLLATGYSIPLPTYLPAGFTIDTIILLNLEKGRKIEDKALYIQYSKKISDSVYQSFYVEAGFDGLGSLWYKGENVNSAAGKLYLYYQPFEETEKGQPTEQAKDLIGTEWFTVKNTNFHVFCIVSSEDDLQDEEEEMVYRKYVPIPKPAFKKILASLKILK